MTFNLKDSEAGQSIYFCERHDTDAYEEIGNRNFFQALKASNYKQILLYIHGYSNLPEPHIFPTAKALQHLFDQKEANLVQVIPLIWPCDNDLGLIQDYFDDQQGGRCQQLRLFPGI